jgi:hypothetical protein
MFRRPVCIISDEAVAMQYRFVLLYSSDFSCRPHGTLRPQLLDFVRLIEEGTNTCMGDP